MTVFEWSFFFNLHPPSESWFLLQTNDTISKVWSKQIYDQFFSDLNSFQWQCRKRERELKLYWAVYTLRVVGLTGPIHTLAAHCAQREPRQGSLTSATGKYRTLIGRRTRTPRADWRSGAAESTFWTPAAAGRTGRGGEGEDLRSTQDCWGPGGGRLQGRPPIRH